MLDGPIRMLGNRLGASTRSDDAVRDTNDDAQLSKLSCVRHGYFQDSFVHHFVRRPTRRSPLINRGYYSRYAALRSLLLQFLALGLGASSAPAAATTSAQPAPLPQQHSSAPEAAAAQQQQQQSHEQSQRQPDSQQQQPDSQQQQPEQQQQQEVPQQQEVQPQQQEVQPPASQQQQQQAQAQAAQPQQPKQVLVLGAGYDTAYFQLAADGIRADKYIELDFLQVAQKKASAIQQLPDLLELVGGQEAASSIKPEEGRVVTPRYCLLPVDLRDTSQLAAALQEAGLDPAAPTYVLSECVLVYLQPQHSREVVRWLGEHLQTAAFVVYEQIQPHDAFGQQMMLNLESRGCALLGIEATPTLEAHRRRFTDCGWQRAEAFNMDHIYSRCIDPQDRRRIERLELFDEFEEWHLIQQHYCIAIGVKDSTGLLQRFGLPHFPPPQIPGVPGGRGVRPGPPVPRFFG